MLYIFLTLCNSFKINMLILNILVSILQKSNYCIQITANTCHERGFSSLNTCHFLRLKQYPVSLHTHCHFHSCSSGATSHFSHLSLHWQLIALIVPSAKVGSSTPFKHRSAPSFPLFFFPATHPHARLHNLFWGWVSPSKQAGLPAHQRSDSLVSSSTDRGFSRTELLRNFSQIPWSSQQFSCQEYCACIASAKLNEGVKLDS